MKLTKSRLVVFLLFLVTIAAVVVGFSLNKKSYAQTIATTNCYGALISVSNAGATTPNTSLRGLVNVNVSIPSGSPQIDNIIIGKQDVNGGNKKILGRARYADSQTWTMPWLTSLLNMSTMDRYQNYLFAQITFSGANTTSCVTQSAEQYNIEYQTQSNLIITATPKEWSGVTNSTQLLSVALSVLPQDLATTFSPLQNAVITWTNSSNFGTLTKPISTLTNNESVSFASGGVSGKTTIIAKAVFGGAETSVEIPMTINAPITVSVPSENPTTATTNTTTKPSTSTNTTTSTSTTTQTNSSSTTAADSTIKETAEVTTSDNQPVNATDTQISSSKIIIDDATATCLKKLIGEDRFSVIESGTNRPTATELEQISSCFASTKYILPTKFTPIDPVKINEVATTTLATVETIESKVNEKDNKKIDSLKFSGKSKPNSSVLVYIFSDPIIVSVISDSNGNWEYSLENPMQPGKHEVYAVVDKGDGAYERTDPMSFFISTAAASDTNPNGLSLALANTPVKTPSIISTNLIIYIAGSVLAIIIALIIFFLVIRSHNKHKLALINRVNEINSTSSVNPTIQPTVVESMDVVMMPQNSSSEARPEVEDYESK